MTAKILVTMEHEDDRKVIADCLEHVGHKVTPVDTFHNAMEILRRADFDLIVSDVHLQNGGSVFDFLRWVKGDPHMRPVPFVCFSAEPKEVGKYLSDGVRTAARALGAAKFPEIYKTAFVGLEQFFYALSLRFRKTTSYSRPNRA